MGRVVGHDTREGVRVGDEPDVLRRGDDLVARLLGADEELDALGSLPWRQQVHVARGRIEVEGGLLVLVRVRGQRWRGEEAGHDQAGERGVSCGSHGGVLRTASRRDGRRGRARRRRGTGRRREGDGGRFRGSGRRGPGGAVSTGQVAAVVAGVAPVVVVSASPPGWWLAGRGRRSRTGRWWVPASGQVRVHSGRGVMATVRRACPGGDVFPPGRGPASPARRPARRMGQPTTNSRVASSVMVAPSTSAETSNVRKYWPASVKTQAGW
ncbi:hypothetical protein G443_001461 [Actinoalloteichus cyanogriseus DSM 43889]|uniref:Uncharacterized protein n=1 Tax=Actinoalloteichus caeruleus DSM 43889 TaxID=1120930 RepID=A0ABT1JFD0_ACTCY|nr:hypothetical protein [Actinoalloteichus caeruleus DSM 43889]